MQQDAINLLKGHPGREILSLLPDIIEEATIHCMKRQRDGSAEVFQYGAINKGDEDFRIHLAAFLSDKYGSHVDSENLFITCGASVGLGILCGLYEPGSVVLVGDPTYYYAMKIFDDYRMRVISVKTDDSGIVIEDLEEKLKQNVAEFPSRNPPLKAMIYTIPVFNNPTGSVLAEDRCQQMAKLARKYHTTIVCDDVYNLLHYDNCSKAPKRLFEFDNQSDPDYCGNVISNGSFSKILGPGLRLGWFEAPKWAMDILDVMGVISSGGGLNTYTSGIVTSLLLLGTMNTYVQNIRQIYKARMEAAINLLREELPGDCILRSKGEGGYFIWIQLPENVVADDFLLFCMERYKISFLPGIRTSPSGSFKNYIRLSISFYALDILEIGLRNMCKAISEFQNSVEKITKSCN